MKAVIRTLLALPMVAILVLGAGLSMYGALHWSWYVLAWGWLVIVALVELVTTLDYTDND